MHKQRMNLQILNKISKLHDVGMDAQTISEMTGVSDSTVKRYRSILRAIETGGDFNISPATYNHDLIKTFCTLHNVPVPINMWGGAEKQTGRRTDPNLL